MKKIFIALTLTIIIMSCAYASNSTITINNVDFNISSQYQGGELTNDYYKLDNIFSIRCIDDNVPGAIGLWASEKDFSEDLMIGKHPVRHYYTYNEYVHGNLSHAYFTSEKSAYEIKWTGSEITKDIEKLIKNTPPSEIDSDDFYNALDKSVDIYKNQKIEKLNQDAQYNYLESSYQSQSSQKNTHDDTRFNRILLAYYER